MYRLNMGSSISVDLRGVKNPFFQEQSGAVRELKSESMFDVATRLGWHIVDNRLDISNISELSTKSDNSPSL